MSPQGTSLFELLPALYKLRDSRINPLSSSESAELLDLQNAASPLAPTDQQRLEQLMAQARGPLQSLLMLIDEQLAILANDLDQLYDDQFIETCAPWVIPYIGDLIGYQPVHGVATAISSPRAEVAHTISFRRRKGTVLVLEQLARDVAGWGTRAVEFFQVLATTQSMKFPRTRSFYSPNLRSWQPRQYMLSGFDATAHNAEVRRVSTGLGRYNVQNIGIFLWSLNASTLTRVTVPSLDATGQFYRFNPLGADIALFNNPVSQGSEITLSARPVNVPDRLSRRALCDDLRSGNGPLYYGEGKSIAIYLNQALLNSFQVQVCDLSGPDGAWINVPAKGSSFAAAIDPELGRIALPPQASQPIVEVSFCYGMNGDMAGGEYPRFNTFTVQLEAPVLPFPDTASPARYTNLQDALTFAANILTGGGMIAVEITDSQIYQLNSATSPSFVVGVPAAATIELRAMDGHRPTLVLTNEMTVVGGAGSIFQMNGLLLTYAQPSADAPMPAGLIHVPNDGSNQLGQLGLNHCTIVPGLALTSAGAPQFPAQASLLVELPGTQIVIQKSILGAMLVHPLAAATVSDSVIDACSFIGAAYASPDSSKGGGSLTLTACTVIGKLHATVFAQISNSIICARLANGDSWAAPLWADRKQQGCLRFSHLPETRIVPRQYECVEPVDGVFLPVFYSLRYGDAGYAKLLPSTCDSVRRGADDGGEMGTFHFVLAPMRETDLRVRLGEYLPVGMELGIFFEN